MTVSLQIAATAGQQAGAVAQSHAGAESAPGGDFATFFSAVAGTDEAEAAEGPDGAGTSGDKPKGRKPTGAEELVATIGVAAAIQIPDALATQAGAAPATAGGAGAVTTPALPPATPPAAEAPKLQNLETPFGAMLGAGAGEGGDGAADATLDGDASRSPAPQPAQAQQNTQSAQSAVAASGATEIVAKSIADGPALTPPSTPAPPAAGSADAAGADAETDAAGQVGADGKSGQTATPGAAAAKEKNADQGANPSNAPEPAKPTDAAQSVNQRNDAAGGDRPAAPPQTSAAPATPSAQNPQAASTPAAQAAAPVAAQVANEIAAHASSRRTRFEVRLDPGELGRVDVRLDVGHDGRVATRLIVERPETLDMLRNDSRELARSLEQAGFQLGQGGLEFQLKDGRAQNWMADDKGVSASSGASANDIPAAVADVYARSPRGTGGLDVTV